ncbi:MAG: CPBP family intramembrane metalloprotease [Gemmatimonadetes bacterium]|nr:CPBP family intramembrane metalloprotease [Gemmatimonadota bacterium]
MRQFGAGFLVAGLAVVVQQLGHAAVADVPWRLNPAADAALLIRSVRWNVNSVLYEELLFRGYLLYQAIRRLGARRGVLLAAAAFGVYHWFSYGIVGNPVMMAFIFVLTGAFGFMFALAFAKTKSIAPDRPPSRVELGLVCLFSTGPLGPGLLVPGNGAARLEATGLTGLLLDMVLPLVLVAGVSGYLARAYPRRSTALPLDPVGRGQRELHGDDLAASADLEGHRHLPHDRIVHRRDK